MERLVCEHSSILTKGSAFWICPMTNINVLRNACSCRPSDALWAQWPERATTEQKALYKQTTNGQKSSINFMFYSRALFFARSSDFYQLTTFDAQQGVVRIFLTREKCLGRLAELTATFVWAKTFWFDRGSKFSINVAWCRHWQASRLHASFQPWILPRNAPPPPLTLMKRTFGKEKDSRTDGVQTSELANVWHSIENENFVFAGHTFLFLIGNGPETPPC